MQIAGRVQWHAGAQLRKYETISSGVVLQVWPLVLTRINQLPPLQLPAAAFSSEAPPNAASYNNIFSVSLM